MVRPTRFRLVLALGTIGALVLASCGGSDAQLLPGGTARDITANLDTVRQLADEGDCVGAESAAQQVSEQVEELGGIDAKLKRALREGAARLNEVVANCDETTGEESVPMTVPTEAERTEEKPEKKEGKEKPKDEEPKEEETAPTTPETTPSEPSPTPQPEGEGDSEEDSSGGVGPGTAVEGEG